MRVLLTRPQQDSEQLAHDLTKLGHNCVIEPLLAIEPNDAQPPDFKNLQAVMLTSAHALDFLGAAKLAALLKLPCFCVGSRTAVAAEQFGFAEVVDVAGDGLMLAQAIASLMQPSSGAILHIAGRDTDGSAQDALKQAGFEMRVWVTYRAKTATSFTPAVIAAWQNAQIDVVLLFSTRTAATLKTLLHKHGLEACCKKVVAIGISDMVLAAAGDLPWRQTRAAETPNEASPPPPIANFARGPMSDEMITLEPVESKKNGTERKLVLLCVMIILFAGSLAFFTIAPRLENVALVANGGAGNGALQEQVNSLNTRLQAVEARITGEAAAPVAAPETNAADAARITHLQGDLDSLSAALSAMQTEMKAKEAMAAQARDASVGMMAEVVAFLPLREAIDSGHGFDGQLAAIRNVAQKDPELQAALMRLEPFSNSGVPTLTMLHDEITVRETSVNSAMAKGAAQTFWQRILAQLQSLITVHSAHDPANETLAQVEIALSKGNAVNALDAFKSLPQDAQQSLADWQKELVTRVETDEILAAITTHFTQQPAQLEVKAP